MNNLFITVVIPCFKQEVFLKQCIDSVTNQSLQTWEAIVVDDGSPKNNTENLVNEYGDRRIKYVKHADNKGLAAARNTGFQLSSYDYILPLDSDDFIEMDFLMFFRV